jgi:hypothetical protein
MQYFHSHLPLTGTPLAACPGKTSELCHYNIPARCLAGYKQPSAAVLFSVAPAGQAWHVYAADQAQQHHPPSEREGLKGVLGCEAAPNIAADIRGRDCHQLSAVGVANGEAVVQGAGGDSNDVR